MLWQDAIVIDCLAAAGQRSQFIRMVGLALSTKLATCLFLATSTM